MADPNDKWSGRVTRESNALDLEAEVFTWKDPLYLRKMATVERIHCNTYVNPTGMNLWNIIVRPEGISCR